VAAGQRRGDTETLQTCDGLIVARAGEWDAYSLLRQLGALPD